MSSLISICQLINLLVAGRDTVCLLSPSNGKRALTTLTVQTASLLSFSLYMLTQYPDIAQRLSQEIFEKVGTTKSPTYDDIRDMKYLRAFLNGLYLYLSDVPLVVRLTLLERRGLEAVSPCVRTPRSECLIYY